MRRRMAEEIVKAWQSQPNYKELSRLTDDTPIAITANIKLGDLKALKRALDQTDKAKAIGT